MDLESLKIALTSTLLIIIGVVILGRLTHLISSKIVKLLAKHINTEFALLFANRLTFIGTVHHELSHALALMITGAKITKLELFRPRGDRLGQVAYVNRGNIIFRSAQNTLSAIAPVLIGCISEYFLYRSLTFCESIIGVIIIIYVMISILLHMTMSHQDFKMALKGMPICFVLLMLIMYFTKLDLVGLVLNL